MSGLDTTLDYKSLSLPDWKTALKKKIKRSKPPSRWELWFIAWTIYCVFKAVILFLAAKYGSAIVETGYACIYWKLVLLERRNDSLNIIRLCCGTLALSVALAIAGVS